VAGECPSYLVTIRNENRGQNFSPPAVVVHRPEFRLFEFGQPASEPLWRLAKDGDTSGLEALAGVEAAVVAVVVAPRVHRKRSPEVTSEVTVCAGQRLSGAAMLAATNDGFVAAVDLVAPSEPDTQVSASLAAYDADSEANTESCDHVPCESHGRRMTESAEGLVRPHPGIRGDTDIPADRGWDGEVLGKVLLRRLP
jgi:hypothetical protein